LRLTKILSQTIYQEKGTQTEPETIEEILKAITTLSMKVDSMGKELQNLKANSQQHDYKYAELRRSEDAKNPELEGDVGKLPKTHNINITSIAGTSTTAMEKTTSKNTNLNSLFTKPFIPKAHIVDTPAPQTSTYAASLHKEKKIYNHISQTYIENLYKIQNFLNLKPKSTTTTEKTQDYLTQKFQGYNKLIAQPKTNPNLVKTCYSYGLLNTVYTYDGTEISGIPEIHKAFLIYKRITKGNLFFIKFYTAPAEILYDEIKPIIQIVKIGLTREMIIPEDIGQQPEIPKIEIPSFYANKRIIGLSTIIQELANNYLQGNAIWSYYSRDHLMIYANSREIRQTDMEEVQKWILSLLKPEATPTTRALKQGFISEELMTRYCKLIGHKYPDHICSKCNQGDDIIPDVQLE
ncbi:uncharacterized protein LOC107029979, partial [Solanum pennellii]|uniref:Uncharacterized protein LOC107006534 n=1 Tax=Solanum pennellii TaxID=28526 RepID=A0ABM1FR57_SOLPN